MSKPANRYYQGPVSDHFDGRLFFNPDAEESLATFKDILKWRFNGERSKWPKHRPGQETKPRLRVDGGGLIITMIGHASLLIQVAGLNILTDPVYCERASPLSFLGPKRVNKPGIRFDDLPKIDIVLVTHNHYDHMDLATLARLKKAHDPLVVTPLGNDTIIKAKVPDLRLSVQDWGDRLQVGETNIHCVPTYHWSARGTRDRRMALWASFVIETPAGIVYHIGDTGFGDGRIYRMIGERFGAPRAAILPIGAYEPRWMMRNNHQMPDEAVQGMMLMNAHFAVGHHWGTFQLTDEAIDAPPEALAQSLSNHGISKERFRALRPGESFEVPEIRA
ncbi:MBL fold metallo-hydrolase [Oryzifoliimicrobium ureilyticus]|uniref:MBL fold metallo-hydrolase n=1 Tax=Oryzifoliimicrobium ureilyticus TaxID=3113724 RepID=UPI0030761786